MLPFSWQRCQECGWHHNIMVLLNPASDGSKRTMSEFACAAVATRSSPDISTVSHWLYLFPGTTSHVDNTEKADILLKVSSYSHSSSILPYLLPFPHLPGERLNRDMTSADKDMQKANKKMSESSWNGECGVKWVGAGGTQWMAVLQCCRPSCVCAPETGPPFLLRSLYSWLLLFRVMRWWCHWL